MAWWVNSAAWVRMATILGGVGTAILALAVIANAMQAGESHWIATRGFVRGEVQQAQARATQTEEALKKRQAKTELQVVEGRLDAAKSKIRDLGLLLQKDPTGQPEYRRAIEEQIGDYNDKAKRLQSQVDDLEREVSGRRP